MVVNNSTCSKNTDSCLCSVPNFPVITSFSGLEVKYVRKSGRQSLVCLCDLSWHQFLGEAWKPSFHLTAEDGYFPSCSVLFVCFTFNRWVFQSLVQVHYSVDTSSLLWDALTENECVGWGDELVTKKKVLNLSRLLAKLGIRASSSDWTPSSQTPLPVSCSSPLICMYICDFKQTFEQL